MSLLQFRLVHKNSCRVSHRSRLLSFPLFATVVCSVLSREACISFIELCKKKNEDALWMDEIAAMQASSRQVLPYLATSGIILAGEDNDPSGKQNGSMDASDTSHGSLDMKHGMEGYFISFLPQNDLSIWNDGAKETKIDVGDLSAVSDYVGQNRFCNEHVYTGLGIPNHALKCSIFKTPFSFL